jgi:hypothetical protein
MVCSTLGPQLAGGDAQDAARVDLELHLHARETRRHWWNPPKLEAVQRAVVGHQLALALQHVNVDGRLVVDRGREHLAAGGWNRGVAQDDLRHHAAHGLDAERQRRHVEQQHLAVAGDEDVGLHGGAERHHFVRIQLAVRAAAEQLFDFAAHQRNPGRPADQDDFVDLRRLESGVGQRLTAWPERALDDRCNQRLELGAADRLAVQRGLVALREIKLRLDDGLAQLLNGFRRSIDPAGEDPIHQQHVDVVAAKVRVAVGRQHLEDTVLDPQDRDVERAAAEVIDGDYTAVFLVEAVRERGGGGLVDDPEDLEAGDAAGIAGRRPLRVVEVGRHRDHRPVHFVVDFALLREMFLGAMLELAKNEGGYLRRRELAVAKPDPHDFSAVAADAKRKMLGLVTHVLAPFAHEPLHRIGGARRVGQ